MIHQIVESVKQEDYRRGDSREVSLMNILQVLHVLQVLQVHTVSRRCQEQFGLLTADTVTVLRPAGDVLREATPAPRGARHCPAVEAADSLVMLEDITFLYWDTQRYGIRETEFLLDLLFCSLCRS